MNDDTGDILATSIDKLPPPTLQSRVDNPGTTMPPNYQDLMKDMRSETRESQVAYQQQQQQEQMQQQQMQQPPMPQPQLPQTLAPMPPPSIAPSMSPDYFGGDFDYYQPRMMPQQVTYMPPPPAPQPSKRAPLFSTETLSSKKLWLVAALVFLVIAYGIPKIQLTFPSLSVPETGKLGTPALVGVAFLVGMLVTAADRIIK